MMEIVSHTIVRLDTPASKLFLIIDMFSLGGMVFSDMYSPVAMKIIGDICLLP